MERHQVGDHFDEQGGIQTLIGELHVLDVEDRFEDFPELFNGLMLFPEVPDFGPAQGRLAEIDQVVGAGGALLEEEEEDVAKGRILGPHAPGGYVNPPLSAAQQETFLPGRRLLFYLLEGEGIAAFAGQDDPGETQRFELDACECRSRPGVPHTPHESEPGGDRQNTS